MRWTKASDSNGSNIESDDNWSTSDGFSYPLDPTKGFSNQKVAMQLPKIREREFEKALATIKMGKSEVIDRRWRRVQRIEVGKFYEKIWIPLASSKGYKLKRKLLSDGSQQVTPPSSKLKKTQNVKEIW